MRSLPGTVKNSSWQSSLSVKVAHLRTLLDYKDSFLRTVMPMVTM